MPQGGSQLQQVKGQGRMLQGALPTLSLWQEEDAGSPLGKVSKPDRVSPPNAAGNHNALMLFPTISPPS